MRKRSLLSVCIILSISLILVGCSNSSNSNNQSDNVVTLKVLSASQTEEPNGEVEREIAEEFMQQNPNIKIEFIAVPANEMNTKITTMATGGDLPDIFLNTPEYYLQYHDMGIAADLTELFSEDYFDRFYSNAIEESNVDGHQVFMPWETMPYGLLYRTDWFEEEGLKPPETWEEALDAARSFTKDTDNDGEVDRYGFAMIGEKNQSGAGRFIQILRSFGAAELIEQDGEWLTELDSPEAVEAFKFFTELETKHEVVPPGIIQTGFSEAISMMASEKAGMMLTGPHTVSMILDQNPELEGKFGGVPVPKKAEHTTTQSLLGYSISNNSENKEEAAKYLEFLVSKENQKKWTEKTYRLPVVQEVGEDPDIIDDPVLGGYIESLNYTYPVPTVTYNSTVQNIVGEAYQSIIGGQETVEEAAKAAAEKVRQEIQQNK
ncbi:sugar ABC transporter substrate-binding protein [Virgibacillus sp. NKC19-3]|uniref:ABC transporter substrate-binding protein n=1 Tax=Virgibacillus saliphilus TaxID=2831674 RepID=UPI001C9A6F80|nr:sugar ABC transporter substrate-binding protein [Virgibacillus sp. NKC19-3]MBY7144214.1 sugar ABC transporter substrate-binding protein [Virgibacillus sp. NKC19-3]